MAGISKVISITQQQTIKSLHDLSENLVTEISVKNATFSGRIDRFQQFDWIFTTTEEALSAAVLTWIVISVTSYGIRNGNLKKRNKSSAKNLSSRKIYLSALLALVSHLLCLVSGMVSNNYSYNEPCNRCYAPCELYDAAICFTNFAILLFLWLRQRSFYLHPSLSVLNKLLPIRMLNWTSLLLLTVGIAVPTFIWLAADNHTSSKTYVCVMKPVTEIHMTPWIVGLLLILICQCMLLGLLVFPLCKQANVKKGRVRRFIIRTSVIAAICVVSNFSALGLIYVITQSKQRFVPVSTVTELSLFVNASSVVFTFEVWRDMLTCKTRSKEPTSNVSSADVHSSHV